MEFVTPFWFNQRQGQAEPAGTGTYRLTAPNMKEAFISIRRGENDRWSAALRATADGPDLDETAAEFDQPQDAWEAAFELYRRRYVT